MTAGHQPWTRTVVMTVATDGSMTVTVNGMLLPPGEAEWTRESFAAVLDQATDHHRESAIVEVREADGSTFTDQIPAIGRRTLPPTADAAAVEVHGAGFLAGEEVAVAVMTHDLIAEHDGTVHAWLTVVSPGCSAGLMLLGRESGTLHVTTAE